MRITQGQKIAFFSLPEVFCDPQVYQKCVSGRGSAWTPLGKLTMLPPDTLVGWRGDTLSRLYPASAFGASILVPPPKPGASPLL